MPQLAFSHSLSLFFIFSLQSDAVADELLGSHLVKSDVHLASTVLVVGGGLREYEARTLTADRAVKHALLELAEGVRCTAIRCTWKTC